MIKSLIAENFLSWERLEFDFTPGITSIEGFNYDDGTQEGSGKSAILNALSWSLFGKIPKDVKVDEVVREGQTSAHVRLILEDGRHIVRSRKPNDLYIELPNGNIIRGKDSRETQVLIESILGLSFEAFCQSVYFAQNFPKKFISATEKERADIISEIQDLKQFDHARKKVMESLNKQESLVNSISNELKLIDSKVSATEGQIENTLKLIKSFFEEKNQELDRLNSFLIKLGGQQYELEQDQSTYTDQELDDNLKEVDSAIEAMTDAKNNIVVQIKSQQNRIQERQKYLAQMKASVERMEKTIRGIEGKIILKTETLETFVNSPKKTCPQCGSFMDEQHSIKHQKDLREELAALGDDLASAQNEKSLQVPPEEALEDVERDYKQELAEIDGDLTQAKTLRMNVLETQKEVRGQEVRRQTISNEIKSLTQRIEEVERREPTALNENQKKGLEKLNELLAIRSNETHRLEEAQRHQSRLRILKDAFKDVKAFVFTSVLEELTRASNSYISELFEVPVQIHFTNEDDSGDLSKIDIQVEIEGVRRSLGLYSGGQFKRIELSVDLALSSIISSRSQNPFQIRCFDEPFQNLSEASMERAINLFSRLKGTTLLIEHNSVAKSICNQIFKIEFRDGVSRRVG